jgi:hypothetical protein
MLLADLPPKYTLTSNQKTGLALQTTVAGFVLRQQRHHHAKAGPWPAGSVTTGSVQKPFNSRRLFAKFLFDAWKHVLSSTNRASWNSTASGVSILNQKGVLKRMTGYQLFIWFETANQRLWFTFPAPFIPNTSLLSLNPPSPFTLAAQTTIGAQVTVTTAGASWKLPLDRTWTGWSVNAQIAKYRPRTAVKPSTAFLHTYGNCALITIRPTTYGFSIGWTNTVEIPPQPGLRVLRFQWVPPSLPQVPSNWQELLLDISVTYP